MRDQEALEHDFFIYVPSQHDTEPELPAYATESGGAVKGERADLPPGYEDWVKISVTGELVVYARVLDEEEQIV
ncbi:MAG: hypothetical protein IMW89_13170 [Ktedonobacteraceae bacterium]|nr:hypothetical protein [Ktedonobacteraceae bacterium]